MRKRLFNPTLQGIRPTDEGWLDLDRTASVEVTSEEKDYGIDSALVSGEAQGWRAASPGTQTIRLFFDHSQKLSLISLGFEETETERTQELVLRWSLDGGRSFREIVRQQWNFSPPDPTREIEEYNVQLSGVTILELVIMPDISRRAVRDLAQESARVLTRRDPQLSQCIRLVSGSSACNIVAFFRGTDYGR
jgi:hypothetical protein